MEYEVNFGRLTKTPKKRPATSRFRLALLGNFSGHGKPAATLADRPPITVDIDTLDAAIKRIAPRLSLAIDHDTIDVPIACLDDFHPDQLVETIDIFAALRQLRRDLANPASFARASAEIMAWNGPPTAGAGLSDFARLTGRAPSQPSETPVDSLLRRLVGPFIQAAGDQEQTALTRQVDAALSAAMRRILHHPDFKAAEALWRGVDFLARRLETDGSLQIVLYDVAAGELAADLAAHEDLDAAGLYAMLVEQPMRDADQGPLAAIVGLYDFALSDAALFGRIAQVAAAAGAPFVTGIEPDPLQTPFKEQPAAVQQAWTALQGLPAAAAFGLATVGFLLRLPYGRRGEPIDAFGFEELTDQSLQSGLLWGNPALSVGLLLALAWEADGEAMEFGSASVIDDLPSYVYTQANGDQVVLPCTERLLSEREAVQAATYHVMPLVRRRGRPEARLAGTRSVAGVPLAGFWAT